MTKSSNSNKKLIWSIQQKTKSKRTTKYKINFKIMAKGIGYQYHKILSHVLSPNATKGVYIHDLRWMTEYCITLNQYDVQIANAMFTPLTEMYLVRRDIKHEIRRDRRGVFISGVGFSKTTVRDLVETLALGIASSEQTAKEAEKLYTDIFG